MAQVTLRFYEELNDYLPPERRKTSFAYDLKGVTVRDLLCELGVPRGEVELILANGESVGFSHVVRDGERIGIFPVFEALDVTPVLRVRSRPLRRLRFLIPERELRRLAVCLRLLGFDVACDHQGRASPRPADAERFPRVLLGRNAVRAPGDERRWRVRGAHAAHQVAEILTALDLCAQVRPLTRCLRCNSALRVCAMPDEEGRIAGSRPLRCVNCHREYRRARYQGWVRAILRRANCTGHVGRG